MRRSCFDRPDRTPRRAGFTLIELLTVIGIIGLLLGITLPAIERVRHKAYLTACSANLNAIGQGIAMYAGENRGAFPRTRYTPGAPLAFGTGAAATSPFDAAGPADNDVTAALWLLARQQHLPTGVFVCPYGDVFVYQPDPADPAKRSNFTDVQKNLGYSFADPYPDANARHAGYVWSASMRPGLPIAADKNPGVDTHGADVAAPDLAAQPQHGSSFNHEKDGQNVLYADGHVAWQASPLCGIDGDNIYANAAGRTDAGPTSATDSVLLPTDDPE